MKRDTVSLLMVWGLQTNLIGSNVKKNLPAMQENWVRSLGQEDPLEKGIATHSSILAWRIPWTEGPSVLHSPWGHKELDTTERLNNKDLLELCSVLRGSLGTFSSSGW